MTHTQRLRTWAIVILFALLSLACMDINPALPTSTAEPLPTVSEGLSRQAPAPIGELLHAPNWDVQVLDKVRGSAAWRRLEETNQFNDAPLMGMEYLMLYLSVTCTYDDNDIHKIGEGDFDLTGDRYVRYRSAFAVDPDPQFGAELRQGEETEGWLSFLVGEDEDNLILIYDESGDWEQENERFIALEEGASVEVPDDMLSTKSSRIGTGASEPASLGQTVTTDDWRICFEEVVFGEDAWGMIQAANQFNEPAEAGMDYVLIKVWAQNISRLDESRNIDNFDFDAQGELGVTWDIPSIVDPDPQLDYYLFPGGQASGWITLQVAQGAEDVVVVFTAYSSSSGEENRYLSLEP